ncbi:MAG: putative toxin-antitoxin system toxin component, PIN family [Candidatus Dormibacteria bacterium]
MLDPNVLISAVLSGTGSPARVLRAWLAGEYDLVISPRLIAELERVLEYPKIARRVTSAEAAELVELLHRHAEELDDPQGTASVTSADPDDDYLIALAQAARAVIVSGDAHLLDLADKVPVHTPAAFLTLLSSQM